MQVNKQGRLYRFAYWPVKKSARPEKIGLCWFVFQLLGVIVLTLAISMFVVILGTLIAAIFWSISRDMSSEIIKDPSGSLFFFLKCLAGVTGAFLVGLAFLALNYWFDTETGKVFSVYIKAKKQKVCLIVEFV